MRQELSVPTALVITENPSVRVWAKKLLDDSFFVILAKNRRSALESIIGAQLTFILIDSQISEIDPLELTRQIRIHAEKPPIFLITGKLSKAFRYEAQRAGISDFISENLDGEELILCIQKSQQELSTEDKSSSVFSKTPQIKKSVAYKKVRQRTIVPHQAQQLLEKTHGSKQEISLVYLRIDNFTEKRKKHGEDIEEKFLDRMSETLSQKDIIVPDKNGNFAIFVPGTSFEKAKKLASRLKKQIETHRFSSGKNFFRLTTSIVVQTNKAASYLEQMIESARTALGKTSLPNTIVTLDQEDV